MVNIRRISAILSFYMERTAPSQFSDWAFTNAVVYKVVGYGISILNLDMVLISDIYTHVL